MRKDKVLRTVVIFQAICLIVLTGLVVVKMMPLLQTGKDEPDAAPSGENGQVDHPDLEGHDGQVVASIGGVPITRGELTEELYTLHGDAVLRQMLVRKAVLLEAGIQGIDVAKNELNLALARTAEAYGGEDAYFEAMREQLGMSKDQVMAELNHRLLLEAIAVRETPVAEEEIQSYLRQHPDYGEPRREMHLNWIVISSASQAEDLLTWLGDGEGFAELAAAYSRDEYTADSGGDLGFIDEDDPFYDPALLAEAGSLQVGDIAGPVLLDDGDYAVIRLAGRRSIGGIPPERVEETVRRELALQRAGSLSSLEERLLASHEAAIVK
ncbi:peptidylprolyl isomerase [Paenibacillus sp. CAU 1782]